MRILRVTKMRRTTRVRNRIMVVTIVDIEIDIDIVVNMIVTRAVVTRD